MHSTYIVVDQNMLRRPELDTMTTQRPTARFVLPDLAFLEMTKGEQWESTLRSSLQILSSVAHRVFVAHSINEMLGREISSLRPAVGYMLSKEATTFVRDLLVWARTGEENQAIRRIRLDPSNHKLEVIADHLNHPENKKSVADLIAATKRQLPDHLHKDLRKDNLSTADRLGLVHQLARSIAYGVLQNRGVSHNKARVFLRHRPLYYRYMVVRAWHCVEWIAAGGFEAFKESDVSNDILDHQYVLTASCFSELLSRDNRVNQTFAALMAVVPRKV